MPHDMTWTLVTGAAIRLGSEIVRQLAQKGHAVAIHYNTSEKEAMELKKELEEMGKHASVIQGSFESKESTQDFVKRYRKQFPRTKYLVNNIGNYVIEPALSASYETMIDLFQTNVFAPLMLIQGLIDSVIMEQGAIVNIGVSGMQGAKADAESAIYTMTKQALLSMTRSLAKELGPKGVRVNMVSPGRLENSVDNSKGVSSIPMNRMGRLAEVASAVVFFLDDGNRYITGQNIDVAGGLNL